MALAFLAFFGVVVGSVLNLAGVASLQHVHTETRASNDSLAEGGAAYAASDTGRSDLLAICPPSGTSASGALTMTGGSGDTVQYTENGCWGVGGPGNTGPGSSCTLCLLNGAATGAPSPSTSVLTAHCPVPSQCTLAALSTGAGFIYVNGSIGNSTTQTSINCTQPTCLRELLNGTVTNCACNPAASTFWPYVTDPLACAPGNPAGCAPASAVEPLICTGSTTCTPDTLCHNEPASVATWSATVGCSATFKSTQATLGPGLWNSLTVQGNPSTSIELADDAGNPGVFVFTGPLAVSGNASVAGSNLTLFLACSNFTTVGASCSGVGGSLSFAGNGGQQLSAPASGQYSGIAVLSDPGLLDSGGSACASSGTNCMLTTGGNGASISGTVDVRSGGISMGGNAGQSISGRLIANSLYMTISGNGTSGLTVTGPGGGGGIRGSCGVFDDGTTGTSTTAGPYGAAYPGAGAPATGRAIIQTQCIDAESGGGGLVTYTSSTLQDTSKSWAAHRWMGATVTAGGQTATVADNSGSTLTLTVPWGSGPPGPGTRYSISLGGVVNFNYVP